MNHVKKIFFEGENTAPSFICETGGTKRPYVVNGKLAWFTDQQVSVERNKALKKVANEEGERSDKIKGYSFMEKIRSWYK